MSKHPFKQHTKQAALDGIFDFATRVLVKKSIFSMNKKHKKREMATDFG
jgi:hypothetical protein